MVILEPHIKQLVLEDAQKAFPDECCGFLFGTEDGDQRILSDILVVNNAKEGDKRRRFEISPRDYLRAEQYALEKNLSLLSVYHSHPNHPAIPSEHDRVAAQPYFSYIIVSVYERGRIDLLSWRLNNDQWFEHEPVLEHALA
jgi:proteasome lid subunit RPN8/RPN11